MWIGLSGTAAAEPAPTQTSTSTAREQFDRGVHAFKDGDYEAARRAFEESYRLNPNRHVLYNVGQSNLHADRPAAARRAFERYLRETATEIKPERLAEVQTALNSLKTRTATIALTLDSDDDGATLSIDGSVIGVAPLAAPEIVDVGTHQLEASKTGRKSAIQEVEVHAGEARAVRLTLPRAVASPQSATSSLITKPSPVVSISPPPPAPAKRNLGAPIATWSVTGILLAGTITSVVLWDGANGDLDAVKARATTRDELEDHAAKANTWGGLVLGLGGATLAAAAVSAWLTLRHPPRSVATQPSWHVLAGLGHVGAAGSF